MQNVRTQKRIYIPVHVHMYIIYSYTYMHIYISYTNECRTLECM